MKRNNSKTIHELIGVVVKGKEKAITSSGKNAGKPFWRLLVSCENHPWIEKVCCFDDKVGTAGEINVETIWNDIEKSNYADKRYLFYCYKRDQKWDLAGWKELEKK